MLIALTTAGCGEASSAASTEGQIGRFEDILVSGPTLVDVKPTSASLLVVTDLDIICAWAYGPTTDYGQVASHGMEAMGMAAAGHAHRDHNPVLFDLQPSTLYHYQFIGTGPDGTVYRSQDFTFQTPAS